MTMQTDFEFTLPRGFVDEVGRVHRHGRMRLAMALDEVEVMQDQRVQANAAYLPILLLSRVVTQLGELTSITPSTIGWLFASDLAYLEDLYLHLNSVEHMTIGAICPHCSNRFQLQVAPLG
jgi:hypothetical protein